MFSDKFATVITALALLLAKSNPSLTFPLQTAMNKAPVGPGSSISKKNRN